MLSRLLWVFAVFLGHCSFALKFSSVTDHVRLGDARGKVVGFVDFNADKATDILFQTDNSISVYLWSREKQRFHLHQLLSLNGSSVVDTVAVDLDADGQVDLLTLTREGGRCHSMTVYWMKPHSRGPAIEYQEVIGNGVLSPPLVLDGNGDHIPDLLTHSCLNNTSTLWLSKEFLREFQKETISLSLNYTSSYYVDLTDDNLADVVVEGRGSSGRSLLFWQRNPSCGDETSFLSPSLPVPLPFPLSSAAVFSPLTFNDIDGDGEIEAVGVTCPDPDCTTAHVHILSHQSSFPTSPDGCGVSGTQPVNFTQVHTVAVHGESVSLSSHPPVLGDLDLDGYPDILLPVSSSSGVLLLVPRQCRDNCNGSKVTLDPQWIPVTNGNVTSAFFFDLWEDVRPHPPTHTLFYLTYKNKHLHISFSRSANE
ncbi:T-cell immunomodulatory protein [Geodia barretti]|uniref:T-cell immunomodulatory protein n=1 Tax=Geodia barretti TaxID=519541 RepID=A0AA35RR75_GEOBA|nr:T-cell immunomodulatory protein [Geodia barretti]